MAAFSENYYLQLYRDALTKPENVEELIKLLKSPRTLFNDTLLADLGVVTAAEWREIDESSRGGRLVGRNERRAKNLIGKVISKDYLKAYRGLRKFIAKQAPEQTEIIVKVFPFGVEEDKAGLAPQIVHRGRVMLYGLLGFFFFRCVLPSFHRYAATCCKSCSEYNTNCLVDDTNSSRI